MDEIWPVQDAKARFSELLRQAETEPQIISYRGKPKYEVRLIEERPEGKPKRLIDALRACPYELELPSRDRSPGRDVEF